MGMKTPLMMHTGGQVPVILQTIEHTVWGVVEGHLIFL